MQIRYRNFPHPVLSHFSDDYVESGFQTSIQVTSSAQKYQLSARHTLGNNGLKELVARGDALYAVHVECRATRYRELFKSQEVTFAIDLPAKLLSGTVDLCCMLVAANDIAGYSNGKFHPDFDGHTFDISKGDILAVAHDRSFDADKDVDQLRRIPSVFQIAADTSPSAPPFNVDTTGQKIVVFLSQRAFQHYKFVRQSQDLHPVLAAMVVIPALTQVISDIQAAPDAAEQSYGELRWFKSIQGRLEDVGLPIEGAEFAEQPAAVIAQKLIGDPLPSALGAMERFLEEG